jgi:uncharacterized repeat protein (TIGR03803 family)
VVFKIDTTGQETVLYTFPNGGGNPRSGAVRDPAGNLYGTAAGFVYKLDTAGKFSVLYRFTGGADGGGADAGVVLDSAGNLYGTTAAGGTAGDGVVYMLDASDRYRETVLYSFTGGADGNQPLSGVVRDAAGNLYGTTFAGGTSGAGGGSGAGVVYKLDTSGQETVLYSFTGGSDGCSPAADVILDSAGTLYGTTNGGGTAVGSAGSGVVFELDTARQETVLHTFTGGADGAYPEAGVIPDHAGSLYGTTYSGGAGGVGSVYKVSAAGQETLLYGFPVTGDGGDPVAGVIRDSAGNLYGTTQEGGAAGWGTVYKLDKTGDETVLYSFTGGADGGDPEAGVIRDSAGNPYGTTLYSDDSMGCGVVYKLDTAGQETVLHTFKGGDDGCVPYAGVTLDSAGNLYGTTQNGGASGWGVVYKVDTSGQETSAVQLHGRTRWRQALRRGDPRFRGQPLRNCLRWRQRKLMHLRRSVQGGYVWPRERTVLLHG